MKKNEIMYIFTQYFNEENENLVFKMSDGCSIKISEKPIFRSNHMIVNMEYIRMKYILPYDVIEYIIILD